MAPPSQASNRRVLVVDDNPSIHEDFRKILARNVPPEGGLDRVESLIFEAPAQAAVLQGFDVESAYQGEEGLAKIQHSLDQGQPYALAFVDMRMPPGWDGAETVSRLRLVDPDLQIVICTAYADHCWEEILQPLGDRSGLMVLKKPFDNIEVTQICEILAAKWSLTRQISLPKR